MRSLRQGIAMAIAVLGLTGLFVEGGHAANVGAATTTTLAGGSAGPAIPMGGSVQADNPIWKRIVELAGGPGARIAVIPVASGRPQVAFDYARSRFEAHGARVERIDLRPLTADTPVEHRADHAALLDSVRRAQAVYFSGGDQERVVDSLLPGGLESPLLREIRALQARGGVVAGTSAGAAVMSAVMFRNAPYLMDALKGQLVFGREIDHGLGFVGPGVLVDQHFLKRGRIGRMLPVMLDQNITLGIGVEEDTGVVMQAGEWEVVGKRGAVVLDLSSARRSVVGPTWRLEGARLSLLEPGDRFVVKERTVLPSKDKARSPIPFGDATYETDFDFQRFFMDILGDHAVANALAHLVDGRHAEVRGLAYSTVRRPHDATPDLGFEFRLRRDGQTQAWSAFGLGSVGYTVSRVRLDVEPVRLPQPLYRPWKD